MINANASNIYRFHYVVLEWIVVTVPCNDIVWAVLLSAAEKLSVQFVNNSPGGRFDFICSNQSEKVSRVC